MRDKRSDLAAYFDRAKQKGATPILQSAVAHLQNDPNVITPGFAIDLGCGEGRDTRFLLEQGWQVLAVDASRDGITRLLGSLETGLDRLTVQLCHHFERTDWRASTLINATLSLPFSGRMFPYVWKQIRESLIPGGLFVGDFFGKEHGWANNPNIACFSKDEVIGLLDGFTVLGLYEWETFFGVGDNRVRGIVYSVVACRNE